MENNPPVVLKSCASFWLEVNFAWVTALQLTCFSESAKLIGVCGAIVSRFVVPLIV